MNPDVPPTVVAPHIPDSASSSGFPTPVLNFSPGTNGHHEPAKDTRFAWLAENLRRKDVSSLARCILGWLVTAVQWRKDRLMIVGKSEIAQEFGIDTRRADRCILELIAAGCLRLVDKGGSLRGQRRKANTYALGAAFEGTPPKARKSRLGVNMPPVKEEGLGVRTANDRGYICPPLPIDPPNAHTIGSSPLEEKVWVEHCKETYPDWDEKDIRGSFLSALAKGKSLRDWKAFATKCYQNRRKLPQSPPVSVPTSPTGHVPPNGQFTQDLISSIINSATGGCTQFAKPSFHQFRLEALRLGIPNFRPIFDSLQRRKWMTKSGSPVKNYKAYLNRIACSQRYAGF